MVLQNAKNEQDFEIYAKEIFVELRKNNVKLVRNRPQVTFYTWIITHKIDKKAFAPASAFLSVTIVPLLWQPFCYMSENKI